MKRRYILHKDGRTIGGIECTPATARKLEARGYWVLPA